MAYSSNEIVNDTIIDETIAGVISGRVMRQNDPTSLEPRSRAASGSDASSVRNRGRMIRIVYGTVITTCPASTAIHDWLSPAWWIRISMPIASTM